VVVFLDGENSKAPLPNVTRDTILPQVARRMSREKPMHKVADRVVGFWPESQVKVIAQQAKSYHANWKSRCSLRQETDERLIISIAVEDLGAAVAPVNHVVSKAGWRRSSRAWHGAYRDRADRRLQGGISYVPISTLRAGDHFGGLSHARRGFLAIVHRRTAGLHVARADPDFLAKPVPIVQAVALLLEDQC